MNQNDDQSDDSLASTSDKSITSKDKQGCLASVAVLAWFFPPMWPVALATTWALYPKTSKKVAIGLCALVVGLLVLPSLRWSQGGNESTADSSNQDSTREAIGEESASSSSLGSSSPSNSHSDIEAEIKCRRTVKESLKDPGSMRIGWGTVVSGTNADNPEEWLVKFPFRARNSFNAVTPGFAQCTVSKLSGIVTWIDIQ
jgi:hypothetical protein